MTRINIHEAKANLSHYLKLVSNGETVVICNRDTPVAELKAVSPTTRQAGLGRQRYPNWSGDLSAALEPLDEDELKLFENG